MNITIHRGDWLLPVSSPPLADGGIAVVQGRIIDLGPADALMARYPGVDLRTHANSVLLPALINAHAHLELSYMAHLADGDHAASFTDWIARLVSYRLHAAVPEDEILEAAQEAADTLHRAGVVAIGDIGNTLLTHRVRFPGTVIHWKEYLGGVEALVAPRLRDLAEEPDQQYCTAHAPYSTHRTLIQAIKKRTRQQEAVFSIHVAEAASELDLVRFGTGEFQQFARQRGFWDGSFVPLGHDQGGSVSYLDDLGVLDRHTLCVHAIHVSSQEIELLAQRGAKVCLCPGSNRLLGVGAAPVEKYLQGGLLLALGTDSRASNRSLCLWREMALLRQDAPEVAPASVLAMATLGGAQALHLKDYGSLEVGKSGQILAVPLPEQARMMTVDQVLDYLTSAGQAITPRWLLENDV